MELVSKRSLERVDDEERLYRSLRLRENDFIYDEDSDKLITSAEAWCDPKQQPSVYRHDLCESPPSSTPPRKNPTDALAQLITIDIRNEKIPHKPGKGHEIIYALDVKPDTTNEQGDAHANICANPAVKNTPFEKLKKCLAILSKKHDLLFVPEDFKKRCKES